jgi:hypothetical protein
MGAIFQRFLSAIFDVDLVLVRDSKNVDDPSHRALDAEQDDTAVRPEPVRQVKDGVETSAVHEIEVANVEDNLGVDAIEGRERGAEMFDRSQIEIAGDAERDTRRCIHL